MDKVIWGQIGGRAARRYEFENAHRNFGQHKEMYGQFENTFMIPVLCEHCLNSEVVSPLPAARLFISVKKTASKLIDFARINAEAMFVYQRPPVQKSVLTGRAASLRSAYSVIRVLNWPATRLFETRVSYAFVILAFCSTTPTGLKKRPDRTRDGFRRTSVRCFLNPHDPAWSSKRR